MSSTPTDSTPGTPAGTPEQHARRWYPRIPFWAQIFLGLGLGVVLALLLWSMVRHMRRIDVPYADEVQGVRAFGSETQTQTVLGLVNARLADHVQLKIDPTLEYQRVGAVKGIILNGDGSTLYNLFNEFQVTQADEVDFDLDAA